MWWTLSLMSLHIRRLLMRRAVDRFFSEKDFQTMHRVGYIFSSLLGATLNRRWLFLPAAVAAFLFQHAIQGWCPPLPLFRRLGFRTASEIDRERYALKFIRGDFRHLSESFDDASEMARQTLDAMQR